MTIAEPAVRVTADSIDPDYGEPFIDIDEQRDDPVPHRYVSGGFKGTHARFSFYFPPKERYGGRFFHNTYPMAITSDIGPFPIQFEVAVGDLGFTLDSGAYYVQTNNGAVFRTPGADPAIAAYRVNAAAAKFSRRVAADVYGDHRPFGYLFGGSGGAYQTMGAAENTSGVWDGFVPFVPGCNHAIPSMFTVRMHALRVLRRRDRFPGIADALDVGGSGDPYAHLDEEEAAAFREVSLMGYPLRGWYRHATLDSGYFSNIADMIPAMDPNYADDFWSQPGYLGTDPKSSIARDRPSPDDPEARDKLWALALETYHRHQVPPGDGYYGWDQFRDASGKPIYPQRDVLIGPAGTANAAGSTLAGKVNGKVLVLAALMDIDSFPWQADWYRSEAKRSLGAAFDDNFALWFVDNAHHENPLTAQQRAHVVSFGGALQQALRDVAAWVEQGVKPPETVYRVEDTQVLVPASAAGRRGIQPVIALQANGGERAEVKAGEAVTFTATVEVPPGAGKVVSAEWNFEGTGDFPIGAPLSSPEQRVDLTATHTYDRPGTHFAVLRVASHREGDMHTPYARVQNIARVRVVVS